ncbi:MAG: S9 family peptidase [Chitinophagaceae bacterium]|nr:S9 family peptidase [Chitinophagaceae bacterium]
MKLLLSILSVFVFVSSNGQEVSLVEKKAYVLPDSVVQKIARDIPDIKTVLSSVRFYHIQYLSDGLKVKGYLAVPNQQGSYPCIIYNRGGNQEFGKITDESFVRLLGEISSKGYVVIASQYRGNDGGEGKEEFGGKDVQDVLNLIPLLAKIPGADSSRIGMFGWSRGGMMTYLALTKTTKIKAAVVGSGLTDLVKTLESRPEFDSLVYAPIIPNYNANKLQALKERSAVYFADKLHKTTPLLILQGTADWRVPTDQVLNFVSKLYAVKHPFRFVLYEGGQHSLAEHRTDYIQQVIAWFDMYLRDGKKWPATELHGN